MKSEETIEYHPSKTTKEEAMLKVEFKAFSKIIKKIRNKEFKYIKITTGITNLSDYYDLAKARCSIHLSEE